MDIEGEAAQKMFLGTYKTYFTGKNRLILSKKFRKELGNDDKVYIVMGNDGELWGFSDKQWQFEAESRLKIPLNEVEGRLQRRSFFSKAEECNLDSQGRFILPNEFVEYSKLSTEVLIIGAGDHFEIWNPTKWANLEKAN